MGLLVGCRFKGEVRIKGEIESICGVIVKEKLRDDGQNYMIVLLSDGRIESLKIDSLIIDKRDVRRLMDTPPVAVKEVSRSDLIDLED